MTAHDAAENPEPTPDEGPKPTPAPPAPAPILITLAIDPASGRITMAQAMNRTADHLGILVNGLDAVKQNLQDALVEMKVAERMAQIKADDQADDQPGEE